MSTRYHNLDLPVDARKAAGGQRVYQDVASGAKPARPALDELLGQLRAGDVLVIGKLDRLGRSLQHLASRQPDGAQGGSAQLERPDRHPPMRKDDSCSTCSGRWPRSSAS